MAKEVIIELKAKTDRIEKDVEGINNEIKTLNKNVSKTEKGFEGVEKATQDTAKGVRKIGTTLKAIGIGLLLAAFSKLKEVFEQNQKVADAFNIAFESLSIAFNDFFNFLDANVGNVIDYFKGIFNNPVEAIKDFGQAIKDNLIERFNSFLDTLGFVASAVKKVFSGDFKGALKDVKQAGKESLDVLTGVNNSFDKSVEAVTNATSAIKEYTKSTIDSAAETIDLNKQVQIANALQQGLIEKYDLQAEKQRQIRDDESKTIDERIKANQKLAEILDKQEKEMLENVNLRVLAAERELAKNKDNVELQVALIEAENELAGVQAQVAGFRSEQLTNINSLERERLDLIDEGIEKREEDLKNEKIVADAKLNMAKNTLGNISKALGENSKAGKAAAAAAALINTYQGITTELATKTTTPFGFALKLANIAATAAIGFKSVKDILKTNPKSVSSAGDTSGGRGGSSAPQAPAFNIVGQGSTNQLADVIAGQSQQPIQAFVVSNDISTAQELDRNIIEGASLG